jgi:hypothetical protein
MGPPRFGAAGDTCQAGLFGSYAQALRYLNATGRLTRAAA